MGLSKENERDYKKLIKYEVSLLDHFKWEQKDRYFLLISNFLNKKIDINQVEELKLDFEISETQLINGLREIFLQIQGYS